MEKPQRHELGSRMMRSVSRGMVDKWLVNRSEWMVAEAQVQKYLAPKIQYRDKLAGKVEKGVFVVSIGSGKGHELDEMDAVLPGSTIVGVDPHDFMTQPVSERLETLAHDVRYLDEDADATQLMDIDDASVDGLTFFFTLHHINPEKYEDIMHEVARVLRDDGYVFVAEDLVDTEEEGKVVEKMDRMLNLELDNESPHAYQSKNEWVDFFRKYGFELVDESEVQPGKVRHGFLVLKKISQN